MALRITIVFVLVLLLATLVACNRRAGDSVSALLPKHSEFTVWNGGANTIGYMDGNGKEVIAPSFDYADRFHEGVAAVAITKGIWAFRGDPLWGFVLPSGEFLVKPQYQEARAFKEGLAAVRLSGKWGFIDKTGKIAVPFKYDRVESFSEGRAAAKVGSDANGKWGFIDANRTEVVPPRFDYAGEFSEGMAYVMMRDAPVTPYTPLPGFSVLRTHNLYGFVSRDGKLAIAPQFYNARPFHEGLAAVQTSNTLWTFIDASGKPLTDPATFENTERFSEGLAAVDMLYNRQHGGPLRLEVRKSGYIDRSGSFVLQPQFAGGASFKNGWARVCVGKNGAECLQGFIDRSGSFVIPAKFALLGDFHDGLAYAELPGRHSALGYIDVKGEFAIPPQFSAAGDFDNGFAKIKIGDTDGYVSRSGSLLR